ncbi:unnamed protein product, partial [Callosobruchus maculatus]
MYSNLAVSLSINSTNRQQVFVAVVLGKHNIRE